MKNKKMYTIIYIKEYFKIFSAAIVFGTLTLSAPNFKLHLLSAFFFFSLTNNQLEKKFICKFEIIIAYGSERVKVNT